MTIHEAETRARSLFIGGQPPPHLGLHNSNEHAEYFAFLFCTPRCLMVDDHVLIRVWKDNGFAEVWGRPGQPRGDR